MTRKRNNDYKSIGPIPIKQDPSRKGLTPLPGFEDIDFTEEGQAETFISEIQEDGFIGDHILFLENYMLSDMGIALSAIKKGYIDYVVNGNWTKDKYKAVINQIAATKQMFIPSNFTRVGIDFDEGKVYQKIETPLTNISDEDLLNILKDSF